MRVTHLSGRGQKGRVGKTDEAACPLVPDEALLDLDFIEYQASCVLVLVHVAIAT